MKLRLLWQKTLKKSRYSYSQSRRKIIQNQLWQMRCRIPVASDTLTCLNTRHSESARRTRRKMYQGYCIDFLASFFFVDDEHVGEASFCGSRGEFLER